MRKRIVLAVGALACACAPPSFEPQSHVSSVRILAIAADQPYAAPGTRVKLSALAVDGRAQRGEPMKQYFLPAPCFNPEGDAYYACFRRFKGYPLATPLDAMLSPGPTFAFTMPEDVLAQRAVGADPYGVAVIFSVACAGHVQYEPPAPGGSPDAVPFVCRDSSGRRLGADEFVFAYSLVYSFAARSNANPRIHEVLFGGEPVDPEVGISMPPCTKAKNDECPSTSMDVRIDAASIEPDPSDLDSSGNVLSEQIYVNYYLSAGTIKNDTVLLVDPRRGRLEDTADELRAPHEPGEQRLWVVLRDNRGGVSWEELAFHVR